MRKVPGGLLVLAFVFAFSYSVLGQTGTDNSVVSLQVDGSKTFQRVDGFGVNANTRSWNGQELEPALNLLIDSMHATIWRVVVETVEKWEEVNDNDDPFNFNWDYYNKLYETPKFRKAFETIRYLNSRGITDRLMINFMGWLPSWMGGEVIKPEFEDEYIEMLVSFFYYARFTKHLQFGLISPMNEPDMRKEGPTVGPQQYVRLLKKLMDRMQALGMGDIRYVAPDVASMFKGIEEYLPVLMKDSTVMSKVAHLGLHSYGGYYANVDSAIQKSPYPGSPYWITEWNSWRDGLDDGKIGVYDYQFAGECIFKILQLLQHGASAGIAWEGYDSYYEHHAPSLFSYWGILGYDTITGTYFPRKHFYAISQLSRFVLPGSVRISVSETGDSLIILAFRDMLSHKVSMVGVNRSHHGVTIEGMLTDLPSIDHFSMYYTSNTANLYKDKDVAVTGSGFRVAIPAECIFTLSGDERPGKGASGRQGGVASMGVEETTAAAEHAGAEPASWYAGDIHVHRNCGDGTPVTSVDSIRGMMKPNDLAVISLLSDNGNGEVKYSSGDMPKVNGEDAAESKPGRIIHWDAEWHWDATYSDFGHQALGGHLVVLGLKEAHQIWDESTHTILDWGRKQHAVSGFAHMEYLNDSIQNKLNCCIPIDYPAEVALGTVDFISEDVYGANSLNNGNYHSESTLNAYYKLLNCGFRIGLAAGTDFPCNNNDPLGTLLTYVNVKGKQLTYRKWIEGIRDGRTVVSRNGHNEFLELTINGRYEPGDEVRLKKTDSLQILVKWTDLKEQTGRIELVSNGKVIGVQQGTAKPGSPVIFKTTCQFSKSGWISARRMDEQGHETQTGAIYVLIGKQPVRASAADAQYFIDWIDNIIKNIAPGGIWNRYYTHDLDVVTARYTKARDVFARILTEAKKAEQLSDFTAVPANNPILVLASTAHFGLYTAEILKTEGFNEFQMDSITDSKVTLSYLKKFDVVILAESALTSARNTMLTDYVKGGGNLIAFRPDKSLQPVFGITNAGGTIINGYIAVEPSGIGAGISTQTLQIHGATDKYTSGTCSKLASLLSNGLKSSGNPAVVMNDYGKGHAIAFLYNLPESIVLTRQGNPDHAGQEMDGITGVRAMDLFTGGWVDIAKNTINQADEQMRLLTHCIESMNNFTRPLPRFWYFPDSLKCLVVLNNDGEGSEEAEFESEFEDVYARGGQMTLYIKDLDKVSKTWVDKWTGRGAEISGHTDDTKEAASPTWAGMDKAISTKIGELNNKYGIPKMHTVVNHWFVWCGNEADGTRNFAAQALLEAKYGIGLDANYAYYDNNAKEGHFLGAAGMTQGNYNGSGLPIRFADRTGTIINVYQLLNNVYDQQYRENKDPEGFFNSFKGLMDRSLYDEVYSYITVKAHTSEYYFTKPLIARMLDYAHARSIPVWTAVELLDFLKAKDEAVFDMIKWSSNQLSFRIRSSIPGIHGLTGLVPNVFNDKKAAKLTVDGIEQPFSVRSVKGADYAFLTVKPGSDHAVVVSYR